MKRQSSVLKIALVVSSLFCASLDAMIKLSKNDFHAPARLGKLELFHEDGSFYINNGEEFTSVKSYNVDKDIRNITTDQLEMFLGRKPNKNIKVITLEEFTKWSQDAEIVEIPLDQKQKLMAQFDGLFGNGYIAISQDDAGNYILRASTRGKGGGPLSAAVAYWVTKTVIYGVAIAGTGAVVVGTGGAAGVLGGAAIGGAGAVATGGATIGMVAVGSGIAGASAGAATAAAVATGTAVTGCGGIAMTVAAVEGASNGVAMIFMWLPLP